MKNIQLVIFTCFLSINLLSQNTLKTKIVNATNNEPVAYAAVGLVKDGRSKTTDENGAFEFDNVSDNDTIAISCVGFKTAYFDVKNIKNVIKITPSVFQLPILTVKPKDRRVLVLNDFKKKKKGYYHSNDTSKKSVVQIGQIFRNPDSNFIWFLNSLKVKQMFLFVLIAKRPNTFRLHFYRIDKEGKPTTEDIWESMMIKNDGGNLTIDLKEKHLQLPTNGLMISIEWLKTPDNIYSEKVTEVYNDGRKEQKKIQYYCAPSIGTFKENGLEDSHYTMFSDMKWKDGNWRFKYNGSYNSLAISLTITD
jgi:CarboxypepD_reg-like domain